MMSISKMLGFEWKIGTPRNLEAEEGVDLECDYEKDCTNLYRNIEEENWSAITKFLETGYWPGHFFADAIPPADQARTWVTRFDRSNHHPHRKYQHLFNKSSKNHKEDIDDDASNKSASTKHSVLWSQLPLHLALVVGAPYEIIDGFIELFPQSVRSTDDQHMLPLHLAMRHGSSDQVVDLLLTAFPEAVNAKGKDNKTPIDCAIRGPNLFRARILETFVSRTNAKTIKSVTNKLGRQVEQLQTMLRDKESELEFVKRRLIEVAKTKAALETDLDDKMIRPTSTREELDEHDEIKNKIAQLEEEKADLHRAQHHALEEEKRLIKELVQAHSQLETQSSTIKEEVEVPAESYKTGEKAPSRA